MIYGNKLFVVVLRWLSLSLCIALAMHTAMSYSVGIVLDLPSGTIFHKHPDFTPEPLSLPVSCHIFLEDLAATFQCLCKVPELCFINVYLQHNIKIIPYAIVMS